MQPRLIFLAAGLLLLAHTGLAQQALNKSAHAPEPRTNAAGASRYALLNINNLTTWMRSDGYSNRSPAEGNGTYFPRGTSWVIYQDGMWMGTPARRGDGSFHAGDEFLIEAWHPLTSQDVWSFNPVALGVAENAGPLTFSLAQNYPNPFAHRLSEATHIAFSLPIAAQVRLRVFNMLGQELVALVDKKLAPGKYVEAWHGKDRFGRTVASGVYFYRLEVKAPNGNTAPRFVRTQKMLVLH
ncbi:T9SS type A sorting domain-containing protein [candidate division KSB1 bacterium]|nr:T9SS type A sorting domain-containing protein [candidate division KSB1 bacterium]